MQKSQRGLMRSAKQQKRKQKLFALCNNNNPINCRRLPGLPLLQPPAPERAYCRWFRWRWLPSNYTNPEAQFGLHVPVLSRSGRLGGERAPMKKASCPSWSLRTAMWSGIWGGWVFALEIGSEFRTSVINNSKTELMYVEGQPAPLFRGYKIILMIKIHHLASPLSLARAILTGPLLIRRQAAEWKLHPSQDAKERVLTYCISLILIQMN